MIYEGNNCFVIEALGYVICTLPSIHNPNLFPLVDAIVRNPREFMKSINISIS